MREFGAKRFLLACDKIVINANKIICAERHPTENGVQYIVSGALLTDVRSYLNTIFVQIHACIHAQSMHSGHSAISSPSKRE